MPKALIISFVEWAGAFQRPQHQAVELARRGWEVTYLGPAYPHRGVAGSGPGFDLPEGLQVATARALPGGRIFSVIERFNESSFQRSAAELAESMNGGVWDAVIFNDPRWAAAASGIRTRVRVWDRMDDLSGSAPTETWGQERENDALNLADLIWAGTPSLGEFTEKQLRDAGIAKRVRFIACGVDAERFENPNREEVERARIELGSGEGAPPLGLYFGALNERVNGKLIDALLEAGWRVALIGPGSSRGPRLRAAEGLRVLGPKPYAALPAYLAAADAGLIPYFSEGPNRHLYPVKALEYLAGGKPVLSTSLPNVDRILGDFVWMGDLTSDWTRIAEDWKRQKPVLESKARTGQAYVRQRTWGAMVDEMLGDLGEVSRLVKHEGRNRNEEMPPPPVPKENKKFPIRDSSQWGAQSLAERLAQKHGPVRTPTSLPESGNQTPDSESKPKKQAKNQTRNRTKNKTKNRTKNKTKSGHDPNENGRKSRQS